MMKKYSIFDYLTNVMVIYGISIISLSLFCRLFGEEAKEVSSIFQMGNAGLAVNTLIQFLFMAFILSGFNWLFFTDKIIKNLSITFRTILMLTSAVLLVAVFAGVFQWFPVDMAISWGSFFVCFFICTAVSIAVSVLKEKSDNKKMQEALERLKEEEL